MLNVLLPSTSMAQLMVGKDEFTETYITFNQLSIEQGLSQSSVNCMLQDSSGFIWIGTQGGLNRFDGYRFTVFKHATSDSTSLSHNDVSVLFEDSQGNLWVGTKGGGLNRFDYFLERFERFESNKFDKSSITSNHITGILEDENNRLWVATYGGGLNVFDRNNKTFKALKNETENPYSIAGNNVTCIAQDREMNVWVGVEGKGLQKFDGKLEGESFSDQFSHDPNAPNSLADNNVQCILPDRNGVIWIATEKGGLSRLDTKSRTFTNFSYFSKDPYSISDNNIRYLFKDSRDRLWIGTAESGLNLYDEASQRFIRYENNVNDNTSLSNNTVQCIFEDKNRNVWLGTQGGGINNFDLDFDRFTHYLKTVPFARDMRQNSVTAFCEDYNRNIWIGTERNGLIYFNRTDGLLLFYYSGNNEQPPLGGISITALLEDSEQQIWIGSASEGIQILDPIDNNVRKLVHASESSNPTKSLLSNEITVIYEDKQHNVWIGTKEHGVSMYDRESETLTHFEYLKTNGASLSSNEVTSVFEDTRGNLWVGTLNGLNLFKKNKFNFMRYMSQGDEQSLSHNEVLSIMEDSKGNVWIGTNGGGLNKLNKDKRTFTHYREKDGLPNDIVTGIIEDGSGYLWISTKRGLSRFYLVKQHFSNFGIDEGLRNNQFNHRAALKTQGGELFFGGTNGFNSFTPEMIKENLIKPPVVLTGFQLFNKPIRVGAIGSPLKQSISKTSQITLEHDQSVFAIEFAALSYKAPQKNQYAYRLEGFVDEWQEIGNQKSVSFTNLDPGTYVFTVKAANNHGVWNEKGASLTIVVRPPFWKTWWFYLSIALILIGCIVTFIRVREQSLAREKDRLEVRITESIKKVEAQRDEIEMKNRKLVQKSDEEKQRTWVADGLTQFNEILSKNKNNLETLANDIVVNLVRFLSAQQGGLIMLNDKNPDNLYLELIASYAFDSQRLEKKKIGLQEGLVGACFNEKETQYVTNLPPNYTKITSGFGETSPQSLLLVPLKLENIVVGVIEIASLKRMEEYQVHFVEELAKSITSILYTVKLGVQNEKLIAENNRQIKELEEAQKRLTNMSENMEDAKKEWRFKEKTLNGQKQELMEEVEKLVLENQVLKKTKK